MSKRVKDMFVVTVWVVGFILAARFASQRFSALAPIAKVLP